jgi:hypothetical protein
MIPGCKDCFQTTSNTMIPIFVNATASTSTKDPRQYYVDCRECSYGHYKIRANYFSGTSVSCPSCSQKWDGCGACGLTGTYCTKCLNTHVFTTSRSTKPCVPCSDYMSGCVWCRSTSDCVKYGLLLWRLIKSVCWLKIRKALLDISMKEHLIFACGVTHI